MEINNPAPNHTLTRNPRAPKSDTPYTVGGAFMLVYLYLHFHPDYARAIAQYVEKNWHDGEFMAAVQTIWCSNLFEREEDFSRTGSSSFFFRHEKNSNSSDETLEKITSKPFHH